MALGTDQITTTTGANFIPEIWSQRVKKAVEENLVMAARVLRFDADVANKGDIVHVPDVSNLTANTKSANTQVTLNATTESKTDITIDKHYEASFLVEDIVKTQSQYNLMSLYTDKAGYAIAHQMDADLIALYSGLSQVVGNGTSAMTALKIVNGVRYLDSANAPLTDRHLVISPYAKKDMLQISNFIQSQAAGYSLGNTPRSPILNGTIGELYGIEVSMSTQVTDETGTTSNSGSQNLLFHRDVYALAVQNQPRAQSEYILEYLGNLTVVDILYGVKEFRDTFGVVVQSDNA